MVGAGLEVSWTVVLHCDVLWSLNLRGLVESQTACQLLVSTGAAALFPENVM
jgi:hypothetical protein